MMHRGHLRVIDGGMPVLSRDRLRHFATPKTWREILELDPRMTRARWRSGIMNADEAGLGLLRWVPGTNASHRGRRRPDAPPPPPSTLGAWMLTDKGREFCRLRRLR